MRCIITQHATQKKHIKERTNNYEKRNNTERKKVNTKRGNVL